MRIIDSIEQLARLWEEASDLAITPSANERFSIIHEFRTVALEARHFNSKQFLSGLRVPNSDIINRSRREKFRISERERHGINPLKVASIPQLCLKPISVCPVDGGFCGAEEEVGRVGGGGDGGDRAHDFRLGFHQHVFAANFGDGAVARTDEQVAVGQCVDAVDALREEAFGWPDALEELSFKGDLQDITGFGSQISKLIGLVDDASGEDSLDMAEVDIGELDFLCDEVHVPDLETIVVDAEQLGVSVVIKLDLVCCACSDWVSTNGFSAFNIPDNELVVVLPTEGGEVALVE